MNFQTMHYDFDGVVDRHSTCSCKWDCSSDADMLPMWIADMDFRTAPKIVDALENRVRHGVFGYTNVPDTYYDAVIRWMSSRHNLQIEREQIIYTTGVVPAISAIIKAVTLPGDKVLLQTPGYNCFFSSIVNNGCQVVASHLRREGNTYVSDYEDLENKLSDPRVRVMLLCNPHNPAGHVWTRDELEKIGEMCFKHNVLVVSDEIHCELIMPGFTHVPFASISEEFFNKSVTCISPSKGFNLGGIQIADIICKDPVLRERIDRAINLNEVCDVNPFGVVATEAAYNECGEWLDELVKYIHGNYMYMRDFCDKHLPQFPICDLQGTYLVWMDCSAVSDDSDELETLLKDNVKLWLNSGKMYGEDRGTFLRWNIACPKVLLKEGLERFLKYVQSVSNV